MNNPQKILYTKQVSDWLGFTSTKIQTSFQLNGLFPKEIDIDLSNHGKELDAYIPCSDITDRIRQASIYPMCLESESYPKDLLANSEQYQHLAQKWHTILSEYYHCLNTTFDQFKPDAVIFIQGYEPINAIVRLLAIEKNIPFCALENTAISDRMLWDNQSGITVHRNLSKSFYWRFCDFIPDEESCQYCDSLIRETRSKKSPEHTSPSTPFKAVKISSGALKTQVFDPVFAFFRTLFPVKEPRVLRTVVFLGQVYTDSSVLFNSASWEDPVQVVIRLARLSIELNFKLIVKLHPKEATGNAPITNKPYNNLTYRKLMESAEFLSLQRKNSNLFIDVKNEYDTYQMIDLADAAVTINSQSGLEAAIRGIPVVVCGHAFYGNLGFTLDAPDPSVLKIQLQSAFELGAEAKAGMTRQAKKFAHIFFEKYCVRKTPEELINLVRRCIIRIP